ncbi:hypothetical protein RFI_38954 [Reticulomyxa filosa]|uniref:Uncharacterized protein n=1 Tax=Reticulomyxa filosa TaxID=46433 RepID=X6LAH9_RETFI|nr:hypothetical protein RFI_38954 [Reticulomyxa filosa]|eukprot:ETN98538.1 hypothetical protein RFI_38954 [Reticulomyxa filosa]
MGDALYPYFWLEFANDDKGIYIFFYIDNWMQSIDPIVLNNTETLDKAVESWTKCIVEAGEATIGIMTIWKGNKPWWSDTAKQLRRIPQLEKHQHMVNSIDSLYEGFTQLKTLNTNKICVIPALVNKETNSVARSDADKAFLLTKTFAEPPQPPNDVDEKHYEMVENEIKCKVAISKPLEVDESCIWPFDIHQSDITREKVIEALMHLSPYKAQGPDNIHNQMLKNGISIWMEFSNGIYTNCMEKGKHCAYSQA